MHKFCNSGAGCTPSCTAGRFASSRKDHRWYVLLKPRAAARPFLTRRQSPFENYKGKKNVDAKRTSARVPVRRAGESPQTRIKKKRAGPLPQRNSLSRGREKGGMPNASQEKTSTRKADVTSGAGAHGGNAVTYTVSPYPADSCFNHTARGTPCLPTTRESATLTLLGAKLCNQNWLLMCTSERRSPGRVGTRTLLL